MVKKEPVSLTWQSVFMFIPIVDLWAAWRIEKLRMFLLINILIFIGIVLFLELIFPGEFFNDVLNDVPVSDNYDYADTVFTLVALVINILLIRKWSREWNKNFSKTNQDTGHDLFYRE